MSRLLTTRVHVVRQNSSKLGFAGALLSLGLLSPVRAAGVGTPPDLVLTGRVTNALGAPIPNVAVSARDAERRITIAGTTDSAGRYRLDGLSRSTYRIAASVDGAEVAVRDTVRVSELTVIDLRVAGATGPRVPTSAEVLSLLPDGEEKRRFVLDCTGCHQFDERVGALAAGGRTVEQWDEAITRMLGYAGATTGFPVISAHRESRPTAEWLARHLVARSQAGRNAAAQRNRSGSAAPAPAVVTEYELPMQRDLPHDVAILDDGRVLITGMMSHQMLVLDPVTAAFEQVAIPVERSGPRAVELDRAGNWWVLLGSATKIGRYRPGAGAWTTWDIGVYPHSVALDTAGRAWFNGHFTRDPEIIGFVSDADTVVRTVPLPRHPALAETPGGPIPYELRVAPDGRVWTSELLGNRLIAHVPGTTTFEVFEMPRSHSGPRRFDIDARGIVWIPAYSANSLVRLDPTTRQFTTFELPVPDAVPYVVRADPGRGRIWIGTSAADAVFAFDPATSRWAEYWLPSRGALVRHLAIDSRSGDVWLAYGASPGIAARVARLSPR